LTTVATTLPRPHCRGTMDLVHQLDLRDMPEIYIFYCSGCQNTETVNQSGCQNTETVNQERAAEKTSQIVETADA
jgi:hypothetical protein